MKRHKNKKILIIVLQVLTIVFFNRLSFALSDGIGNPTVPASSTQRGLIKSPALPGNSSGQVTASSTQDGMHFRGLIPYRESADYNPPIGYENLNLYLNRASANPSRAQKPLQIYYPKAAGSASLDGTEAILTHPNINNGIGGYEASEMPETSQIAAGTPLYDYNKTRPLSYDSADLERVITYDLLQQKNKDELTRALQKAGEEASKTVSEEDEKPQSSPLTYKPIRPVEQTIEPVKPAQPAQPGRQPIDKTEESTTAKTVYEQMLEELTAAALQNQKADKQKTKEPNQSPARKPQDEPRKPTDLRSPYSQIDEKTAEAVVGIHKSFATKSKDKFNYYMRSAEEFLRQGKYYRAADAYTLADIYKPNDPLAFAGRAHALFASGEYMSSAYFLSRAISIFPQYVKFKIDLNAMIPDRDRLESRIADIKLWIERTNSAELSFLLAYIYYQLDKIDLAAEAIKVASEKIPDSVSITALKQAIEKK
ncbi:MAG: hypothetical protein PHP01_05385 [Phycisphaerae bacterium]|nr:hypothetical protein [Phycisphaerae bacterium]